MTIKAGACLKAPSVMLRMTPPPPWEDDKGVISSGRWYQLVFLLRRANFLAAAPSQIRHPRARGGALLFEIYRPLNPLAIGVGIGVSRELAPFV